MAGCKSAARRAQSDECATRTAQDGGMGEWESGKEAYKADDDIQCRSIIKVIGRLEQIYHIYIDFQSY